MKRLILTAAVFAIALGACSNDSSTAVTGDEPAVLSVSPPSGSTNIDPGAPIVIGFSQAMMQGAEFLVDLHRGSLTGEVVVANHTWSADHHTLTITPTAPLSAHMSHVVHLAPTLRDAEGTPLNHDSCTALGGHHVTDGMMAGGMHGDGHGMMGSGWQAVNGSYGTVFTFTTR